MGGKVAVALGLVAGIVAGGMLVGGILALTPGPDAPLATVPPTPFPTAAPSEPPASASPAASAVASSSPAASPSGSPAASAPSAGTGLFGVREPAPPLRLAQLGGTLDQGLQTILPGVTVTP